MDRQRYSLILTREIKNLTGMKVYTTDEQELIMEPSVKWAGNPNITVLVKAYGLKATTQVHYMYVG